MDVYVAYAEDQYRRFAFYFSYQPGKKEVEYILSRELKEDPHIFDIFPEPKCETITTEDILSIKTKCGNEMFIPKGLDINLIGSYRVLFGI